MRGNGNPLQYSCLGNPRGRGAWPAEVHRLAELDITELILQAKDHPLFIHCSNKPTKAKNSLSHKQRNSVTWLSQATQLACLEPQKSNFLSCKKVPLG